MATEKQYSPREVCGHLAKAIKEKVDAYAAEVEELRKRELTRTTKKLRKSDLCPLCGNADAPGSCTCIELKKNATMGYGPGTPGAQPAAGLHMNELCKGCGKPHGPGKCMGKGELEDEGRHPCPTCGAEGHALGALGRRTHYRCRQCGMQYSTHDTADKTKDLFEGPEPKVLHPSDKKSKKKPVKKDEKAPGAKLPPKRPKVAEASEGSGGNAKKGKKLAKAVLGAEKAPALASTLPAAGATRNPALGRAMPGIGGVPGGAGAIKPPTRIPLKDLVAAAGVKPAVSKLAPANLPGMTEAPPGGVHPETTQSLHELKLAAGRGKAVLPSGAERPFVKKPAADTMAPKPGPSKSIATNPTAIPTGKEAVAPKAAPQDTSAADLAADKKAAGVGFFNNLFSKLKGTGNKTWEETRGMGASPARALRSTAAAASALYRSEDLAKTSVAQANQEIAGFRSLAVDPTAQRPYIGDPKDAASTQANREMGSFHSLLGNCVFCNQPEHRGDCSK